MNRKFAYGGLVLLLVGFLNAMWMSGVFAASIKIGPAESPLDISENITSVSCNTDSGVLGCSMTGVSGRGYNIWYGEGWSADHSASSQEAAIENRLRDAGMYGSDTSEGGDEGSLWGGGTSSGEVGGGRDLEGGDTSDDGGDETAGELPATVEPPDPGKCAGILPPEWCEGENGEGVWQILMLVLNIMTAGIGVLATIGLVISGIQWLTARDKEDQIVKAKSRIFNIVIGIIVWALMWLVLTWLIPGFTLEAPSITTRTEEIIETGKMI